MYLTVPNEILLLFELDFLAVIHLSRYKERAMIYYTSFVTPELFASFVNHLTKQPDFLQWRRHVSAQY